MKLNETDLKSFGPYRRPGELSEFFYFMVPSLFWKSINSISSKLQLPAFMEMNSMKFYIQLNWSDTKNKIIYETQ